MADILDEILAATESVRAQLSKPQPLLLPYDPEVSPRGVQDELPFALLHNPPTYFDKSTTNNPTLDSAINCQQHQQVLYDHSPFDPPKWASPPPTPETTATAATIAIATPLNTAQHNLGQTCATKRGIEQVTQERYDQHQQKRTKPEPSTVMPPSAKSILERREKAIREGRRKDAKLTESERRILRRLRNRESAERCRLRRVQQAAQLEKKIESMQIENDRLVAMAEEYEKTIQRLEQVIANFSKQSPTA